MAGKTATETIEKIEEAKKPVRQKYRLSYQRNQRWELTIGGRIAAVFEPGEVKEVDAGVVEHPDFAAFKELFTVQEVR